MSSTQDRKGREGNRSIEGKAEPVGRPENFNRTGDGPLQGAGFSAETSSLYVTGAACAAGVCDEFVKLRREDSPAAGADPLAGAERSSAADVFR